MRDMYLYILVQSRQHRVETLIQICNGRRVPCKDITCYKFTPYFKLGVRVVKVVYLIITKLEI